MNYYSTFIKFLLFIGFALQCFVLHSQSEITKDAVKKMWEKSPSQLWVNEYEGLLDGFHPIKMVLSTNGEFIKGMYQFTGQNAIFLLEGEKDGVYYILSEIDDKHHTCGYLNLEEEGNVLNGQWTDIDNTRDIPIQFSLQKENLSKCDTKNWYKIYEGSSFGEVLDIHIKRSDNEFMFTFWKENKPLFQQLVESEDPSFQHTFNTNFTANIDSLVIKLSNNAIKVISVKEKLRAIDTYYMQDMVAFKCEEKSNFRSRFTINYPFLNENKFDSYIYELVDIWRTVANEKNLKSYRSDPADISSDRLKNESFIWSEIDLYTKDFISGNLYFQKNWEDVVDKVSFNYDLKKNKLLDVKDLFSKNIDDKLYLKKHSSDISKDLKYVNLNMDGLVLRSDYDIVYGQSTKLIPYSEILSQLNHKISIISKMKD